MYEAVVIHTSVLQPFPIPMAAADGLCQSWGGGYLLPYPPYALGHYPGAQQGAGIGGVIASALAARLRSKNDGEESSSGWGLSFPIS